VTGDVVSEEQEPLAPAEPTGEELAAVEEPAVEGTVAEAPAADEPAADEPAADEPAADEPAADEPAVPDDVRLSFAGVEVSLPDTNPVLILQEADPPYRELRMPIGSAEGVAIAYAWRQIDTPRPLSHELFADVMRSFGLTLDVVRITDVRGTSFSAELVISGRPGPRVLPCRPSDGVALALRQRITAPIVAARAVMEAAAR
jgi:bifunctional DNase/RNase